MLITMKTLRRAAGIAALAACACAQAQDIPVAGILSATGPTAFAGVPVNNGIKLAIEQANAANMFGAARIKYVEGDYAGDKGQAINLANQAIRRDRVVLAFGPNTTADSIAVAPVFNDAKTPFFALATSNRVIETGPYTFKSQAPAPDQLPLVGKYAIQKTPVRRVAVVFDRSNEGMIEHKDLFREAFKAGGGTILSEDGLASNESNFLPLVTKILSQNPDGVFFSLYAEQAANLMVQLRQGGLGPNVRFFANTSIATPRLIAIAGKAAEGAVAVSEFISGLDRNKAFEAAYKARFGVDADSWAAVGYTMGQVGVRAVRDAGANPTPEKVRDAMMKVRDVPVPLGDGKWSHNERKPVYTPVIVMVKDGRFVAAP